MQHVHGSAPEDTLWRPWWKTSGGFVLCGFLLVAGFYLVTEHTAHAFGALPFVLILACPLLHLFHHHGHGGHAEAPVPPVTAATPLEGHHDG